MADQPKAVVYQTSPFVNLKEVMVEAGVVTSERAATALIKKGAVSLIVASLVQDRVFPIRMAHTTEFLIGATTVLRIDGFGYLYLQPVDRSHVEKD